MILLCDGGPLHGKSFEVDKDIDEVYLPYIDEKEPDYVKGVRYYKQYLCNYEDGVVNYRAYLSVIKGGYTTELKSLWNKIGSIGK